MQLKEYLHTSFENPDPEYVDGEIIERGLGDLPHSATMSHLAGIFGNLSRTRPFFGYLSLRLRVGATRIRVPDVVIYAGTDATEDVPTVPPLVTIEVLSPDDRYLNLMEKFDDYSNFGVRYIWLADPERRTLHAYTAGSLKLVAALEIPEYDARITPAEIFG
jgi:Uma2 family endonuclease